MISEVLGVYFQPAVGPAQEIGYEYQTYGGQEYFEPFIQITAGMNLGPVAVGIAYGNYPVVQFNGNVFAAINAIAGAEHEAISGLPAPFNSFTPTTAIHNLPCHVGSSQG